MPRDSGTISLFRGKQAKCYAKRSSYSQHVVKTIITTDRITVVLPQQASDYHVAGSLSFVLLRLIQIKRHVNKVSTTAVPMRIGGYQLKTAGIDEAGGTVDCGIGG